MISQITHPPQRPAWVEIDLERLRRNFSIIQKDKPADLAFLAVVKDDAYGHGAVPVAQAALAAGAVSLAVATLDEALTLRANSITSPILIFGERPERELAICIKEKLSFFVNDPGAAAKTAQLAQQLRQRPHVHLEIDTGMCRYGVRWENALPVLAELADNEHLVLEGVMSHFAMSDELDKSFALRQLARFQRVLNAMQERGISVRYRHLCNTGGYLDLPQAHFDLVRIGILPLGVYPSRVCRHLSGLQPVMQVKARIAALQDIQPGDTVGYGMRYRADSPRRIAVLPLGFGDGYPRVRNKGFVLVHGRRAPIVGGLAMDAIMIDVTDIPAARLCDEVVLMGRQGEEEISVHEIAGLKGSVSYDILCGWRSRLPRVYTNEKTT